MIKKAKPIDAVIAWVDGNDPVLSEKRNSYLGKKGSSNPGSGAATTRFASVNEIKYCVLSIMRFAPFIRNIYVVTDGQDPELYEDIRTHFPARLDSYKVVDHKEIFEGYEDLLPTFNSISIAHMIWRIRGISETFVYFNDDTFLIREMKPEDWFLNDQPLMRGKWVPAPHFRIAWDRLRTGIKRTLLRKSGFKPRASFHLGQWNSAAMLGFKWRYFTVSHTPHTVERKLVEAYFNDNTTLLTKNISFRFRDPSQFTFIAMSNHLQLSGGNRQIADPGLAYLQPYGRSSEYIDKKIAYCENKTQIKFVCVQSLDLCKKEEQDKVLGWIERRLDL